jgi:RNA polymerase sigma-70 factor (ECF subfamily)
VLATAVDMVSSSEGPAELVQRAQAGDMAAFEALYREHYPRVYALALRMLRDGRAAEELSVEIFARAWESLSSFRGQSAFGTWLHRLGVNQILNHLRTERRRHARITIVADLPEGSDPGDAPEDPSERLDLDAYTRQVARAMPDTRIDLERAIAALPDRAREALILHHVEGYKYREIAELMGTKIGTVKAQIHRACALIREALAE